MSAPGSLPGPRGEENKHDGEREERRACEVEPVGVPLHVLSRC